MNFVKENWKVGELKWIRNEFYEILLSAISLNLVLVDFKKSLKFENQVKIKSLTGIGTDFESSLYRELSNMTFVEKLLL